MQTKFIIPPDGFPTGPTTPEGAACDLIRARFIYRARRLFQETCLTPPTRPSALGTYFKFYYYLLSDLRDVPPKKTTGPEEIKAIRKLYFARDLSNPEPRVFAARELGWVGIKFVDMLLEQNNGKKLSHRVLVAEVRKNLWFAHPLPNTSPLVSAGFNAESPSQKEWRRL